MALSPAPDLPFTLPSNCFTIHSPVASHDQSIQLPSMRVKVEVEVALPSSLVGHKPRKKRGFEENLDVVVSIGGKVELSLDLVEESLKLLIPSNILANEGELEEKVEEVSESIDQEMMEDKIRQTAAMSLRRMLNSVG